MPKSSALSQFEQGQVWAFKNQGYSIRKIASKIKRSKSVVHNCVQLGQKYAKKSRSGRPPTLSAQDKRTLSRLASNFKLSSEEIRVESNVQVSSRRIRQVLQANNNIIYGKCVNTPRLLPRHKTARLQFAEKYQFWDKEWSEVVFSDEKKFNLDGPDGFSKCWQDVRKPKPIKESRNFGGGTLMIWAGFSILGKTPLCFISTKMDSKKYVELLDEVLIQFSEDTMGNNMIFQQDNASCHTALFTKNFLKDKNIPTLDWPACSPDLNPIENVWGLLSQKVFKHGRRYESVKQLKQVLTEEWAKIDVHDLRKYIETMPGRLQEVIIKRGGPTHY